MAEIDSTARAPDDPPAEAPSVTPATQLPAASDHDDFIGSTPLDKASRRITRVGQDYDPLAEGMELESVEYKVKPRTSEDLDAEPPPRQHYPVYIFECLKEMWRSREVLFTFVERDIRVRYKQAFLGAFWAILQPLVLMVIFSLIFGKLAHFGEKGIPYPIFVYTALVPWQLFSSSVGTATQSIITNYGMIRKTYMPREVFPLAAVMTSGVDFLASNVILLVMLLLYGYGPRLTWFAYPLVLLLLVMIATTASILVAGVTVYARDTRYGIPMILQIFMYASPVVYPLARLAGPPYIDTAGQVVKPFLHGTLKRIYPYANPLAPVLDGFRRVLIHGQWPQWKPFTFAFVVAAVALGLAYLWYKHIDRNFADVV